MTREEFDAYCGSLPATTHVIQWGGSSVWKVGGKIFAICTGWGKEVPEGMNKDRFSFKCSDLAFELLPETDGIIPAPHLARAKWVQVQTTEAMSDDDLRLHLDAAHEIIAKKLTKKLQKELGLNWD